MSQPIWQRLIAGIQTKSGNFPIRSVVTGEVIYTVQRAHLPNGDERDFFQNSFPGGCFAGVPFFRQQLREADFSCCRLTGAMFDDADLSGASLREADLRGTSFQRTRCVGADLTLSDLWMAKLARSHCELAVFVGTRLFQTDLQQANFAGADFRDAAISSCKCAGARFREVNFRGSALYDLEGADLAGANLIGAYLESRLSQVRLHNTLCDRHTLGPDRAPIPGSGLLLVEPGCDLRSVHLRRQDLTNLDLSGADLRGAILERCQLQGSSLAGADLRGATLLQTDLRRTCLEGTRLDEAQERLNPRQTIHWTVPPPQRPRYRSTASEKE